MTGEDERVADWIAEKTDAGKFWPPYTAIGFERDGALVAGIMFDQFNGSNVEITVAGRGCFLRTVRDYLFSYAFDQLKVRRVTIRTRASNKRVRGLCEKFGCVVEGYQPAFYPDDDAILFGLIRKES